MSADYTQEIRRALIRQTLVEMARTRRHASAMSWISELSIEEEEYAKSIFQEVEYEAAGGNVSGGHVSVSQVWDDPAKEIRRQLASFTPPSMEAIATLTKQIESLMEVVRTLSELKVTCSLQVPANIVILKGLP